MHSKNNWIRDWLGVTVWHKAGYTGRRGLTLSGEDFEGKAIGAHAQRTLQVFHEIAPDREVRHVRLNDVTAQTAGDTMFVSMSGNYTPRITVPAGLSIFVSAGNDGEEKSNGYMRREDLYGVGAVKLVVSRKTGGVPAPGATIKPTAADFTSLSDRVDFGSITGMYTDNGRLFNGTSCAAPVLCGMAALINDMAIMRHGRALKHKEMAALLRDLCLDVHDAGRDDATGWGLPILPPPEELDLWRYMEKMEYKDDFKINPAHKADVYRAAELGLMLGDNCYFDPKSNLTREQAATVLVRLYEAIKGDK